MMRSGTRHKLETCLVLLVAPMKCKHKAIAVTWGVFLKQWGTAVIYHKWGSLIEVILQESVAETLACLTAKGITDVYRGRSFFITIANFGNVAINLPKYQKSMKSQMRVERWFKSKGNGSHTFLALTQLNVTDLSTIPTISQQQPYKKTAKQQAFKDKDEKL